MGTQWLILWPVETKFHLVKKMSEECPWRILGTMGTAFSVGLVYSTALITWRGISSRNWLKIVPSIRQNASNSACAFASFGLLFSISECSLMAFRRQDDKINRMAAGGITGFLLSVRRGILVSMINSFLAVFILSLF